ncbi:MAG: tetratricopeptide repeat protein [Gemmatimonadetes bacterium]|nr:tetratricopeptide repeat protein [Gemmatimonadota bacterium]
MPRRGRGGPPRGRAPSDPPPRDAGDRAPRSGAALAFLGTSYHATRDFARRSACSKRMIALRARAFGRTRLPLANNYNNLAVMFEARGDYIAAQRLYEWTLAIVESDAATRSP